MVPTLRVGEMRRDRKYMKGGHEVGCRKAVKIIFLQGLFLDPTDRLGKLSMPAVDFNSKHAVSQSG